MKNHTLYSDFDGIYYWNLQIFNKDPEKVYVINWLRIMEGDEYLGE